MPVVLVSYYFLGLPLGALLAFRGGWGARGIVVGLFVGKMSHFLLYGVLVLRTDWQQQVEDAARRVSSERPMEAAREGAKTAEEQETGVEATSQTREDGAEKMGRGGAGAARAYAHLDEDKPGHGDGGL